MVEDSPLRHHPASDSQSFFRGKIFATSVPRRTCSGLFTSIAVSIRSHSLAQMGREKDRNGMKWEGTLTRHFAKRQETGRKGT